MQETPEITNFSTPAAQAQAPTPGVGVTRSLARAMSAERLALLLLSAIFLVGLGLRVYCLDCYSLWYDEIASVETAQRGLEGIFGYRFGWPGNQTPLHYILVWLGTQPADPTVSSAWVRGFSVLAGALTVPVVYRLGSLLFTRAHGLIAALMTALAPTLLDYSQELRPYSMMTFLTVLSVMCLVEAARSRGWRWWVAFAAVTILNLLNSVVALTMVMPSLGLYCLFLAWRFWRERRTEGTNDRRLIYLVLSLAAIGGAALPMLLDVARTPRVTGDVGGLTIGDALSLFVVITNWFTQLDIGGQLEQGLQLWLLALAAAGGLLALRGSRGERQGAVLLILFVVVPWLTLSYFLAQFFVVQRYVIASIPFYLLLISYALVQPFRLVGGVGGKGTSLGKVLASVPGTFTVLFFLIGAANYANVDDVGGEIHWRPDFRAAAAYLSAEARPGDAIVFVDQNALGYTSAMFYWRGAPPTLAFDARDPRIGLFGVTGDVYWVFSSLSDTLVNDIMAQNEGRYDTTLFKHGVAVVREAVSGGDLAEKLEHLVARLRVLRPEYLHFVTLEGNVYQATGRIADAAAKYHEASREINKVLGFEYLRTSQGFAERGHIKEAWREAAISKFMWSGNPDLHDWLSELLRREGHEELSRDEAEIARLLRAMP